MNEFDFYKFAEELAPLKNASGSLSFRAVFFSWMGVRTAVSKMLQQRPFLVSRSAGEHLIQLITELVPESMEDAIDHAIEEIDGKEHMIQGWQVARVTDALKNYETVLAAECQVLDTYLVLKSGAYSTADLVERAHILFGNEADRLPVACKHDFDQAGRSLAFMLPTAAAFHILRGTETVIREYYQIVVGTTPKKLPRNWGAYVTQLEKHGAKKSVTAFIDHVRESYRNPILHPEESVDQTQALILLGACVSLVSLILREMESLKLTSALLPLSS